MLAMLLNDINPIPTVSAGSASTSQAPGCSPTTWQLSVTWSIANSNPRHWQIDVWVSVNGGTATLLVADVSGTSITDDTGVTSDGTIVTTDSRAYSIRVVARGQGTINNSTDTGTVNQTVGNPC